MAKQPHVTWAQRESLVFINIEIDEAKIEDLKVTGNTLHFQGTSHNEKYETTLELFDEVDAQTIKRSETNSRVVELAINKKEQKWWPRLFKEKGKVHWLRVDFNKWVDEDESGAEDGAPAGGMNDFNLDQYMQQLGGGQGGGMPSFGGLDDDEESDGDMPDLEEAEPAK